MNRYRFSATCNICGGIGAADVRAARAAWVGGVVHRDPSICRDELARQKRELDERAKVTWAVPA